MLGLGELLILTTGISYLEQDFKDVWVGWSGDEDGGKVGVETESCEMNSE